MRSFRLCASTLLVAACLAVSACASLDRTAEATYGAFVIAEKTGAQAIQSPEINDSTKAKIQSADAEAKPLADTLLTSLLAWRNGEGDKDSVHRALEAAIPAVASLGAAAGTKARAPP